MRWLALFLKKQQEEEEEESIPRSFFSLFCPPALLARSHCCESESGANGRSFATIDSGHATDRGGTDSRHGMHACGGGAAVARRRRVGTARVGSRSLLGWNMLSKV